MNRIDPSGHFWKEIGDFFKGVVNAIGDFVNDFLKDDDSIKVTISSSNKLPTTGEPNTTVKTPDGTTERTYGPDGRAKHDTHNTNHGNSQKHPKVPHEHDWDWSDPEHPHPGPWYSAPVINWGNVVIGVGLVISSTAAIIWVVGNDMTGVGVVDDWALPGLAGTFGKGVVMIFGG